MIESLSIDQLFLILDCEDLSELSHLIGHQKYLQLITQTEKKKLPEVLNLDKINHALFSAIVAVSNPIEIWWATLSLVSIGIAAAPITVGISLVTTKMQNINNNVIFVNIRSE